MLFRSIREGNKSNNEYSGDMHEQKQVGYQAASRAFDLAFDLGRPVKPRWPNAELEAWVTRQDAGLAALGQGWPFAAAHGSRSAFGYAEPRRGTEWWGIDLLVELSRDNGRQEAILKSFSWRLPCIHLLAVTTPMSSRLKRLR